MNPQLSSAIVTHLWQSTLFAGVVWLAVLALRANHARVRYWLWAAASLKFLVPFSWLVGVGAQVRWRTAAEVAQPAATFLIEEVLTPPVIRSAVSASPAVTAHPGAVLPWVLAAVWLAGTLAVLAWWWRQWRPVGAALRTAVPVDLGPSFVARDLVVLSSPSALEPGIVGILRPVLLLPDGLAARLPPVQMNALIAHERCHIRCRDNLMAAVHMLVEATFWFHPLVWWIERRMIDERERACDEAVLAAGSEPQDYAEGILEVCRSSMESPLACVAGVSGADLRRRIESIMGGQQGRPMTTARRLGLALAGMSLFGMPVLAGLGQASDPLPQFDVISIRENLSGEGGGGGGPRPDGRYTLTNMPTRGLISIAYEIPASRVLGGPGWLQTSRYDMAAVGKAGSTEKEWQGMLQAMLRDRFQLRAHLERRDLPVYFLTVARADGRLGPNVKPAAVNCRDVEVAKKAMAEAKVAGLRSPCGITFAQTGYLIGGERLAVLEGMLTSASGRPVLDRTGLDGLYDVELLWNRADAERQDGMSIFTAVREQLGLRLDSGTAPLDVVVIDRIERPSEN